MSWNWGNILVNPLHQEALSDSITLRFKLKRMGLAAEDPIAVELLALVDALGYQKMLANQPVATRFSAVKRPISNRKIHE